MVRIAIIGGGFGGIRCALNLSRRLNSQADILLIDPSSGHVFSPSLYEVASAYQEVGSPSQIKLRRSVSITYSEIFKGTSVKHIQAEVISVDTAAKIIYLRHGKEISYDYCVFAIGGQATDFNIPGVKEHAYFFKTVDDALRVNNRLYQVFRTYLQGTREKPLQIILGGAGFTGVELAAELAHCLRRLGRSHGIKKKFFSIIIFEAAPQMLPMLKGRERRSILKRLTEIGVAVIDHSPIEQVYSDQVKLSDGRTWRGDLIIWTTGIRPHRLISYIPELPLTDHKKIKVNSYLQVEGTTNLFAIGDTIEFIDPKTLQPVPMLAYNALDQGSLAAANISSLVKNHSLRSYKPRLGAWVVPTGGKSALFHFKNITISGFLGWLISKIIDLRYFISILSFSDAIKLFKKDTVLFSQND